MPPFTALNGNSHHEQRHNETCTSGCMDTSAPSPPRHNQMHQETLLDEYQLRNMIQHVCVKTLKRWNPSTWNLVMGNDASPDSNQIAQLTEFARTTIIDLLNEKLRKAGKQIMDVNDFSYLKKEQKNEPQNSPKNPSGSPSSNSDVEMQQ